MIRAALPVLTALTLVLTACGNDDVDGAATARSDPSSTVSTTGPPSTSTTSSVAAHADRPGTTPRPSWLGQRVLPLRPDGLGEIQPTPAELADRRFATIDILPVPDEPVFDVRVEDVPDGVLARSTWQPGCPVSVDDLRYLTLPFWGFDDELHTGELLVHVDSVDAVRAGFAHLFETRFPIEEMRVVTEAELDAAPTGDGNNTSAFVCRPSVGSSSWSQHAYGRAVDINPFHNPYVRGDIVIPELASTYVDRSESRAGMLDAVDVTGFTGAGWKWGGAWSSTKDYMHLSASGG